MGICNQKFVPQKIFDIILSKMSKEEIIEYFRKQKSKNSENPGRYGAFY
jgi:hypothetical protein